MSSPAASLLKLVDRETGPVTSITSTPLPGFLRRWFWHSTAGLHEGLSDPAKPYKILFFGGGGWSADKEESQCKAVTEAIERWAFRHYAATAPADAGLHLDPTTNGFAALPAVLGVELLLKNAYHEALERWAVNRVWFHRDVSFARCRLDKEKLVTLFAPFQQRLRCFQAKLLADRCAGLPPQEVVFCLCIFETESGGAIPGSACAETLEDALRKALQEAYVHVAAFSRMKKRPAEDFDNIQERRLHHFASNGRGYAMVRERIMETSRPTVHRTPDVVFSGRLAGPWNPDVLVHRVLVADSPPMPEGGLERFFF